MRIYYEKDSIIHIDLSRPSINLPTLDPVVISWDNGIAILANLTEGSANLTATLDTLENKTNQTANQTDNTSLQTADDLWSWGRVPVGYEVDRNGSLIRLSGQEWTPSI